MPYFERKVEVLELDASRDECCNLLSIGLAAWRSFVLAIMGCLLIVRWYQVKMEWTDERCCTLELSTLSRVRGAPHSLGSTHKSRNFALFSSASWFHYLIRDTISTPSPSWHEVLKRSVASNILDTLRLSRCL